jgi:Domain of unknown function (DUF1707)
MEAPVTAEPWDQLAACMVSRERIRASDADRDRVLDTLGTAFVDGRLTEEDFHARAIWALTSRTYGDLAAVTVSIPPRREAPLLRTVRTDLDRVDKKSLAWGMFLFLMPATLATAFLTHDVAFFVLFVVAFIGVTVTAQPDT